MMRIGACWLLAAGFAAGVAGNAAAQTTLIAHAKMIDQQRRPVGTVTFTQMAEGVLLRVELQGLPPGWHAFHLHETAICEPPFASAGGHFNPGSDQHGFDENGPHVGDFPNVHVSENGMARAEFFSPRIALAAQRPTDVGVVNQAIGAVRSAAGMRVYDIVGGNGTAVVVHAKPDDYRTDPAGDAGDRIACGVIQRG